jgi:hypothetical protein
MGRALGGYSINGRFSMNDPATFLPVGDWDPAPPVSTSTATVPGVDRAGCRVAGDVMTRDPDRVACGDTLLEVVRRMRSLLVAFLPVCDEHGDLRGIVALRDVLRVIGAGDPSGATASSLAEEPATTIGVDDPVDHVRGLMVEQRMWLLPVLDGPRLVGVVRYAIATGPTTPPSADWIPTARLAP